MSRSNCIVMIVDAGAFPIAAAVLRDLHAREPDRRYDTIVYTDLAAAAQTPTPEIDVRDLAPLHARLASRLGHIDFIRPSHTITLETYCRWVLSEFLEPTYAKCLYLDFDILIRRPLSEAFDVDIADFDFAAAASLNHLYLKNQTKPLSQFEKKLSEFDIVRPDGYFNAGVLLLNMRRFGFESIADRVDALHRGGLRGGGGRIGDQDLLNRLYAGAWTPLSPRWNLTTPFLAAGVEDAIEPRILHFCGGDKPWHRTWPGAPTYRRDVTRLFERYGVHAPEHRNRKGKLSDAVKGAIAATAPARAVNAARTAAAQSSYTSDFIKYFNDGVASGAFADI